MANEFGEAVRAARRAAGMSLQQVADGVGVTRAAISAIELGRVGAAPATVAALERVLGLAAGSLARHLPADHPARRMAAVEIPVLGVVAAGPARDDPAEPGQVLRVSQLWAGCVAYRVRGDSMLADQIRDGDYLVVRPADEQPPQPGDVVVVWLADLGGHVVKRLDKDGRTIRSRGAARWSHRLTASDRVLGTLVGLVRIGA